MNQEHMVPVSGGSDSISLLLRNPRRRTTGAGMATVLVLTMVLILFIYAAAEVFIAWFFAGQRQHVRTYSYVAAEAAAATATAKVRLDNSFGTDVDNDIVEIADGDLVPHQTAYVQFDRDSGKPYSVNNLNSDAVVAGFRGTPVPAYGAQIIGVGSYGDKETLFEIVIARKGITHAAASSGQLVLSGHNEAASIETQGQLMELADGASLDPAEVEEKMLGTTVASGGTNGEPLVLAGNLTLYGDAISAAGIRQEGDDIRFLRGGGPRTNDGDVEIPVIEDIEVYDPQSLSGTTDLNSSYSDPNNLFQGRNRVDGDLTIDGDLELDGAIIYVTGNLTVNGNIKGDGALVSLGSMSLTGHSTLQADSKVALISKGDLSLTGTDADNSLFSGLIYSEGNIQASRVTIVGGLVANNPNDPEAATMEVTDTRLVNLPEKTKFHVSKVISAPNPPTPGGSLAFELVQNKLKLLPPDLAPLIGDNGTWNGTTPSFRFERLDDDGNPTGVVYNSLAEVPSLSPGVIARINSMVSGEFTTHFENTFLTTLNSQNTEVQNIFQLDPNQLLTRSEGYKVLLRRSL